MFGKWSRRDIIKSSGAVAPVVLVAELPIFVSVILH